ncbi:hypothetical protein ALAU109921_10080 [Alteromonas australica]
MVPNRTDWVTANLDNIQKEEPVLPKVVKRELTSNKSTLIQRFRTL